MRVVLLLAVFAGLLVAGCRSSRQEADLSAGQLPKKSRAKPSGGAAKNTAPAPPPANQVPQVPEVRAVEGFLGRIIAVRGHLQFVVVDFPNRALPRLEQRLNVYRLDQKVAEIRISGPYLGTTVAADVLEGMPNEGDLVKDR